MSHAPCSRLDRIPFPPPHSTPSLLYPPNRSIIPCNPQQGVHFGRLAEQSLLTNNDPVEVSSTEVSTVFLPQRKASMHWFDLQYNSGEDIATTLASSEVDERPNWGMLASPLLTRVTRRETSAAPSRIYNSNRENSESRSSRVPTSTERPVAMHSHRESQVQNQMFCKSLIQREREREKILTEHREISDFLELRANHASQGEQKKALSRLSEAEYHTRLLLEEQKNHILSEARSELNMQELRVESADMAFHESGLLLPPGESVVGPFPK